MSPTCREDMTSHVFEPYDFNDVFDMSCRHVTTRRDVSCWHVFWSLSKTCLPKTFPTKLCKETAAAVGCRECNFIHVMCTGHSMPNCRPMLQQRTSGSTIPATTTKRHTVQNMAALTAVYQSFYGHPSWEAHCTIKIWCLSILHNISPHSVEPPPQDHHHSVALPQDHHHSKER